MLFGDGEASLRDTFQTILNDFFPRYLNVIRKKEYINEIFSSDFYNLHFWFFDDTVQAIGFDGQFIVVDFNNDLIILRNSLYYPLHSGDYILCTARAFVCDDTTGPVTLPEALLGVSSEFSMSEFLRILKTP